VEIGDLIRRAANRFGDAPAITCGDRTLSFREFDAATDRLGNALLRHGLEPGDRVAVLLPNGIDGLIAYYALAKSGLVRVSLNVRDTPADHEFRLRDSGSRALISDRAASGVVEWAFDLDDVARMVAGGPDGACDVPRDAEAPYRLGYTGGTTGPPKAVTLSLRSEHAEITNYLLDLVPDIRPRDVMVHAAPVTHASGSFFLPHLIRGAHNVMLPSFQAGMVLEELQRRRATATFLVPTMLAMVLDEPGVDDVRVPALRRICYGAAPIAPSVAERAEQVFGRVLAQTYGQSEAPMTITLLRPDEHDRIGSAGRPYTMVEVRVVDDDDREVPAGQSGEVAVRGQILMSGYWNRPEETARTLRGGWLHTGDVGRFDDDGFLHLLDRRNDVIISGGFNVYPREVEDVLLEHPDIREAAVVGVPDERWGEVVQAVVATRGPVESAALLEWARPRLAGYKRPRALHIRDDLPKSSAGKILRRAVRDDLARDDLAREDLARDDLARDGLARNNKEN
jgi:acyl-CoA synthetase (AMP-forming)/AMP-acid ligase II